MIILQGVRMSHIAHGVVAPPTNHPLSGGLLFIFQELSKIADRFKPDKAAVEESFVNSNAASTLKLGHAQAAAILAAAQAGIPVAEYAARYIKKTVVGTGAADKDQIGFMVRRLLPLAGISSADAADALAVAISHAHSRNYHMVS
jgi:crossover junction endodeoxyribonuclease RuvC